MSNMHNIPCMKTINEAAGIVNLAKYHIRQLVLQDKIRYVKAGQKYLVNLESLIEYLNNGETHVKTELENLNKIRKVGE